MPPEGSESRPPPGRDQATIRAPRAPCLTIRTPCEFLGRIRLRQNGHIARKSVGKVSQVAGLAADRGREAGEKLAPDHLPGGRARIGGQARIGARSSHTWFALTELLGYPDVKDYEG